jgi:hypothetical protein
MYIFVPLPRTGIIVDFLFVSFGHSTKAASSIAIKFMYVALEQVVLAAPFSLSESLRHFHDHLAMLLRIKYFYMLHAITPK